MAELRRRHRALVEIAAVRSAERAHARQELFLAEEQRRRTEAAREEAGGRLDEADAAWRTQLGGTFEPDLARALAGQLVRRAEEVVRASDAVERAAGQADASADAWREGDLRCRLAERSLSASRRALARDRDERLLDAVAARVTFAWSRG